MATFTIKNRNEIQAQADARLFEDMRGVSVEINGATSTVTVTDEAQVSVVANLVAFLDEATSDLDFMTDEEIDALLG